MTDAEEIMQDLKEKGCKTAEDVINGAREGEIKKQERSYENAEKVARAGLEIKAIKLSPDKPFVWASGFQMPIYNDNRMFLEYPEYRALIAGSFVDLFNRYKIHWNTIAGTSTAGISPATTLGDISGSPIIYVRDKPKDHGLRNQIEGIDADKDLQGKNIVLIEDLISTGGSSARAVQAIRNANGICNYCLSIFNYGLDKAIQAFDSLDPKCNVHSILTYDKLLEVAKKTGYINKEKETMLEEWRADPFGWGEKHGFPKIEKGN